MRDPAASINFTADKVIRTLHAPMQDGDFLVSGLAQQLIKEGKVISFEITGKQEIAAERLPFVTYPFEWCDAQFYDAARLTLDIQKTAVAQGFDLKDASLWNVIFDGCRPLFCDLLSLTCLERKKWLAMGQFTRHFLLPLVLSKYRSMQAHQTMRVWRDGVPPETARALLGVARFLTRYWPLVGGAGTKHANTGSGAVDGDLAAIQAFRNNLHASVDWMLAGVAASNVAERVKEQPWVDYTSQRVHYPETSVEYKKELVAAWLKELAPAWVLDLGCNTGEFSEMAIESGARVIALDSDHASIQKMYLKHGGAGKLHPVLAPIDDFPGGRGWQGGEFPSLMQRLEGRCDVVLMLAIIHHLAIAASIPLVAIAKFASRLTRDALIIELLDSADPQVQLLCRFHNRQPEEFSLRAQRQALEQHGFVIEKEVDLKPARRVLLLCRKSITRSDM